MKRRIVTLLSLLLLLSVPGLAAELALFVDGVKVNVEPLVVDGNAYFPVDQMAKLTGARIESQGKGIKLAGCPVEFTPLVQDGKAYLPAEAFAMATGGQVERDEVRGVVLYRTKPIAAEPTEEPAPRAAQAPAEMPPSPNGPDSGDLQEATAAALQAAAQETYATRWLRHKMYWMSKLDPANSPYLQYEVPGGMPIMPAHPWSSPWATPTP